LFKYLQFQLLVVDADGQERWKPHLNDGQPELLNPREVPDFMRQIGRNTSYIIHPDEILADNFVHMVMQTPNRPDPQLIEKIRAEFEPK